MKLTFEERQQISDIRAGARGREKKDRKKSPKASRGRDLDASYLNFLRRQACCVAGHQQTIGRCSGATQAAHIRFSVPGRPNPGLQRKSHDRRAVPLCSGHHLFGTHAQHDSGERKWWEALGVDPDALADDYYQRFQGGNDDG